MQIGETLSPPALLYSRRVLLQSFIFFQSGYSLYRTSAVLIWEIWYAKLLQKSEMRKDIVIELSYKGFSWSGYNSWSQYNHSKSQILTPQRYLFVTMPDNATNGYGWRNKTLRNSELPTTHAKNLVTEKDCAVPPRFAYRHRTLHQLILKPKN